MKQKDLVGKIVIDSGKLGIIINEIKYTVLSDNDTVWVSTYEIKYTDGSISLIKKDQLDKLISIGKITVLEDDS